MRARTSTSGLNMGCVVTSATRSPSIQTWRPSRMDSRYSSPVRIICVPFSALLVAAGDIEGDVDQPNDVRGFRHRPEYTGIEAEHVPRRERDNGHADQEQAEPQRDDDQR